MEKDKQDDGLSDLSDILGDLKGMAVEMGSELDKYLLKPHDMLSIYFCCLCACVNEEKVHG